jgi:hypothetical protein
MTQQHPITPPPELVQQWTDAYWGEPGQYVGIDDEALATRAAQWGADAELEACCEWLQDPDLNVDTYKLRAARRPKPPSLKEQALDELHISFDRGYLKEGAADTIRRALEALPE